MTMDLIRKDLEVVAARQGVAIPPAKPRAQPAGHKNKKKQLPLPPALRQAAADALKSYRASPEYQALLDDMPKMNLLQLQQRMETALNGPHFAPMLDLMRKPDAFDVSVQGIVDKILGYFIPQAVSLGIMAQAVFIIGISGSAGYVVNVDLSDFKSGVYVGGAGDLGLDAGVEGDVVLGFWMNAVGDLGGHYKGGEVDIDDLAGVVALGYLQDEQPALVFVGVDIGVDDGFEGSDLYVFEFDIGHEPIYQPGDATYMVQFTTMTCENSKDNYDTVYIEFFQDGDDTAYRFPAWNGNQMCEASRDSTFSTWNLGEIVKFNSSLTVRLHAGDFTPSPDVTIKPSNFNGVGSTYTLPWDDKTDGFNEVQYKLVAQLLKA
ncbi:MAG TPA: hypothetical protein VG986_07755 [Pseudolabrys sp.]|nr:hypothetical protein [Pseudolabrys sp.]